MFVAFVESLIHEFTSPRTYMYINTLNALKYFSLKIAYW